MDNTKEMIVGERCFSDGMRKLVYVDADQKQFLLMANGRKAYGFPDNTDPTFPDQAQRSHCS